MKNSFSRALLLISLMLVTTVSVGRVCAQSESLPAEQTITFTIGGDEKSRHDVILDTNEFFQIRVEQLGIDVLLRLLNTAGDEVARTSLPRNYQSEILLTFVAPTARKYQLEIGALDPKAAPGRCTVRREPARPATRRDRRRVEVEHTFAEGITARNTKGQVETALRKFTEARDGWEELNEVRLLQTTKLLIFQQQARAKFYAARMLLNEQVMEPNHQALKQFEEASKLYHEGGEPDKEVVALLGAALAAKNLKNFAVAIHFTKQALPFYSSPENRVDKSSLLMEIVRFANAIGDDITALEHLLLALPIYEELDLKLEITITRMTIGAFYYKFGDYRRSVEFLTEAMRSKALLTDKCHEMEIYINLAAASLALDRKAEALRLLRQEIPPVVAQASGCDDHRAALWNNLGAAYHNLGDYGLAIRTYSEALNLGQDRSIKANTYFNLGEVYFQTGRIAKALNAFKHAEALYSDAPAEIRRNLDVRKSTQSLPQLQQLETGLKLRQSIGDKIGAASTLNRLCLVYLRLNNKRAALAASQQALTLYAALNDQNGEAIALGNAMQIWQSLGKRPLAIFFGKQSLNKIQELRRAAAGIEVSLQQNYLRTFKNYYQLLAQLLVEEGMFEQAIQVLNLYRNQDSFDLKLNHNVSEEGVYLSATETAVARHYEAETSKMRTLQAQIAEFNRHLASSPPPVTASADLEQLRNEFKKSADAFDGVLRESSELFSQPVVYADNDRSIASVKDLQKSLRVLGGTPKQRSVLLYTFATDKTFYVLLVRPEGVETFSQPTTALAINDQVKNLLTVLRCPTSDPYKEASKVYDLVFKSVSVSTKTTLEARLEDYKPELLLWSLGDELGSVPMAALYDSGHKQYLVERYQHAIANRVRPDLIQREPRPWLKGIGFGAAREYSGYGPALPGVKESLSQIFDDPLSGHKGIIDGPALVDDQFKRSNLENLNGRWPLVHIATHFIHRAGDADNSTLLLGDGVKLSLSEIEKQRRLFAGVELLVLSACKTSVQQADVYGKVIEGLASLSQRLGATSVIATLWNVSDLAASERDILFYRLYREHQDWPKSEVLRQSQLSLLKGKIELPLENSREIDSSKIEGCLTRSRQGKRFNVDPKAPLAHPYYWAPFVLYGSSR